jgi:hypothetical protein
MTTKRCNKCQLVKSTSEFNKNSKKRGGLKTECKKCQQLFSKNYFLKGLAVAQSFASQKGCCNHCQRQYTNEDWHFFEFDHIDPILKKHRRETDLKWIAAHSYEFETRIAPNLQLLCVKCHKIKTSEECKLGGSVHQKMFGQSKPIEVLDPGWDLFNPVPVGGPDDLKFGYTALLKEGEWITERDIDGNLIRYEPYSNYIKH